MPPRTKAASLSRVTKAERSSSTLETYPALRRSLRTSTKPTSPTSSINTSIASASTPFTSVLSQSSSVNTPAPSSSAVSTPDRNPVYFWHPKDGNGFLGQWYWCKFVVDGETYATAEMWMMVQKARLFKDEAIAKKMLATTDPKTHKALGRKVKDFDGRVWDEHKLDIVTEGNYHKFTVSEDAANLRSLLLATGDRELVEASSLDRIWGVGFAEKNAGANRHRWGQNLLGKAIMSVRERLRAEDGKKVEVEAKA